MFGWAVTFGKVVVSCGPWKNSCENQKAIWLGSDNFFIKKLLREPTYHPQSSRCGPLEGARGAAWGGRGASMMMRAETRAHQSRAAHPPDKACGGLAGGEVRGAEEAVARGRRERRKKRIQTGIYIINGKWVICMPKS